MDLDTDTVPAPPPTMSMPPQDVPVVASAVAPEPTYRRRRRHRVPPAVWFAVGAAVVLGVVLAVAVAERLDVPTDEHVSAGPAVAVVGVPRAQREVEVTAPVAGEAPPTNEVEPTTTGFALDEVVVQTRTHAGHEDSTHVGSTAVVPSDTQVHSRAGIPTTRGSDSRPSRSLSAGGSSPRHRLSIEERRRVGGAGLELDAIGELQVRDVRAIITRNQPRFRQCYDAALRRVGSAAPVRVVMNLVVDTRGRVSSVAVDGPSFGSLHTCLRGVASRFHFPPSLSGGVVPVPLGFSPGS